MVSQPCLPHFRREWRFGKHRGAAETGPVGGAERWRVSHARDPKSRLTGQPRPCTFTTIFSFSAKWLLFLGPRAALARNGPRVCMWAAPALTGNCIKPSPFLPPRMHCAHFPGPRGHRGSKQSVSGILCFYLGLSFPIYLTVSLSLAPHTTDIFLT